MPPLWLLDAAERQVKGIVGLSAEQYAGFLADPPMRRRGADRGRTRCGPSPDIRRSSATRSATRSRPRWCAGSAAASRALPRAPVRRRQGRRSATGSSPTSTTRRRSTSSCPFLDLLAFNVYLEPRDRLEDYLADSALWRAAASDERGRPRRAPQRRGRAGGGARWADPPDLRSGCAGAFVFSWTDEWFRAGAQVDDWAFGITRSGPLAEARARRRLHRLPRRAVPRRRAWPRVSVVVCTHNGSRTLRRRWRGCGRSSTRPRGDHGRRRVHRPLRRDRGGVRRPADPHAERGPRQREETSAPPPRPARSSPISTTTPGPIRTGSSTSDTFERKLRQRRAARTCRPRTRRRRERRALARRPNPRARLRHRG